MTAIPEPSALLSLTARELDAIAWMIEFFDSDLAEIDGYDVYRDEIPSVLLKVKAALFYI